MGTLSYGKLKFDLLWDNADTSQVAVQLLLQREIYHSHDGMVADEQLNIWYWKQENDGEEEIPGLELFSLCFCLVSYLLL